MCLEFFIRGSVRVAKGDEKICFDKDIYGKNQNVNVRGAFMGSNPIFPILDSCSKSKLIFMMRKLCQESSFKRHIQQITLYNIISIIVSCNSILKGGYSNSNYKSHQSTNRLEELKL